MPTFTPAGYRRLAATGAVALAVLTGSPLLGAANTASFTHADLDRPAPADGIGTEICGKVNQALNGYLGGNHTYIDPILTALPDVHCRIDGDYQDSAIKIKITQREVTDPELNGRVCPDVLDSDGLEWIITSGVLTCTPGNHESAFYDSVYFESRQTVFEVQLFITNSSALDIAALSDIVLTALIDAVRDTEQHKRQRHNRRNGGICGSGWRAPSATPRAECWAMVRSRMFTVAAGAVDYLSFEDAGGQSGLNG